MHSHCAQCVIARALVSVLNHDTPLLPAAACCALLLPDSPIWFVCTDDNGVASVFNVWLTPGTYTVTATTQPPGVSTGPGFASSSSLTFTIIENPWTVSLEASPLVQVVSLESIGDLRGSPGTNCRSFKDLKCWPQ